MTGARDNSDPQDLEPYLCATNPNARFFGLCQVFRSVLKHAASLQSATTTTISVPHTVLSLPVERP